MVFFSSLIHSGSPCSDVEIQLPQAPPADLDLSFLASQPIVVRGYWAHHLQQRQWRERLVEAGATDVIIHDEVGTASLLKEGLDL